MAVAGVASLLGAAGAQEGGGLIKEAIQKKLAAVKESSAANKAALKKYTWTETVQTSLNGQVKSTTQSSCRYGPDGQVVKTPIGPPPQQPKEGPLRARMMAEKKEELTGYMAQVKGVIGLYVPPDAQRMEAAFQAGNLSFGRPGAGEAGLNFKSYAKPGDSMILDFDTATKKMASLIVNSSVSDPSQTVTLTVQFASLPDGTSFPSQTVLNAPAKGIQVTTSNSNYQKLPGQ